ncbi:MAG: hypothetical protein ACI4RP_05130, partial [Acutalibacteraceae bacterium]
HPLISRPRATASPEGEALARFGFYFNSKSRLRRQPSLHSPLSTLHSPLSTLHSPLFKLRIFVSIRRNTQIVTLHYITKSLLTQYVFW